MGRPGGSGRGWDATPSGTVTRGSAQHQQERPIPQTPDRTLRAFKAEPVHWNPNPEFYVNGILNPVLNPTGSLLPAPGSPLQWWADPSRPSGGFVFLWVLCSFPSLPQATQTLQYLSSCFKSSLTWCCQGKQRAVEKLFFFFFYKPTFKWSLCHSLNPASPFSRYFHKTICLSGHITRMFYHPENPRWAIKPQLERCLLKTWRGRPKTSI